MNTPDPADVHTGTDRVELTEDEREALEDAINESLDTYANASFLIPAVGSIVAARTVDLRRWKCEAIEVIDGLQELGKALGLPLGERITGPKAVEAVQALTAERERLAEKVGQLLEVSQELCAERDAARAEADELRREIQAVAGGALVEEAETSVRRIHAEVERDVARQALTSADAMNRHWDEINAERDRLQAELAAANARCAELEALVGWEGKLHAAIADDLKTVEGRAAYQAVREEVHRLDTERAERAAFQIEALKAERDALRATLDRVTALADEADRSERHINGYGYVLLRALRAALTPEGTA